jgi:hypothetical protein
MNKTIVIGVGGTGLDAIRSLRKLIVENYGSLEAETVRNLGILYLDTDPSEIVINKDNKAKWEVLGKSIALSPAEYKIMSAPDIASVVKDIDSYPHIKEWLPLDDLDSINKSAKDTPGASQIRPLGRFIFAMSMGEIEAAFKAVLNKVPQAAGGGDTHVYIINSLSGGTGGGMFLDLAYMIQEWTAGNCKTFGFLVFPELTTSRGIRYTVNAYASLLELNYFSNSNSVVKSAGREKIIEFKSPGKSSGFKSSPFDCCYIVGPRNNAGVELDLSALPGMIAHRIFLNFDSSFSAASDRLLNNGKMERANILPDPYNGNLHSRNFYTFGLSSIQYPIDQFIEVFSFKLAKTLIDEWQRPKDFPGDINARVQGNLPLLKLTDEYLLGDKDFFGSKHFDNFEVEVEGIVNNLRQTHPQKNIAPYLAKQLEIRENEFRGVGTAKFYQNKRDDLNGALREAQKLVKQKISADLINPEFGYDFCEKSLDEMIRMFKEKHKVFVDRFNSFPAKEKNSRGALAGFLNELTKNEDKLLFKDKALKDSMGKIADSMKVNLSAKVGLRAYELGIAFVSKLIEDLETQKENLKSWRDALEKIKNEIEVEINKRLTTIEKKIENVKEFNGSLLFSESKIDEGYRGLDIKSALSYIESEMLKGLEGGVLDLPYTNCDVDALYKIALMWLQEISVFRISDTNVTDKLIEDYPDETQRRDLIRQNFNKCYPFLTVDQAEVAKGFGEDRYSITSGTTNTRLVGILNPDKEKSTAATKVVEDVRKATADVTIEAISDRHQILFLQEYTAFPLRIIRDLKTLKEQYDQYFKNSKPLPLHIAKSYDPPLMDLFLTTAEHMRDIQKAEANFLLGRAVGKLKLEENVMQGKQEVRYRFIELGTEKFVVFGNSWESAFDNFLKDDSDMKKMREKLDKDLNVFVKDYQTKVKRDELWFTIDDMMRGIRDGLDYHEDNPLYKKYNEVRSRVVKNLDLYDEGNPPNEKSRRKHAGGETRATITTVSGDGAKPTISDEGKFIQMVRTTMRNSKDGSLSPVMQNMLKTNQKKYGVTDAKAEQIIEEIRNELFGSQSVKEYKELFEAFYEDGEINEDERAVLIERQIELELSDEQVKTIESDIMTRRSS